MYRPPKPHMILIWDRIKIMLRFFLALLMESSYIQIILKHPEKKCLEMCDNLQV